MSVMRKRGVGKSNNVGDNMRKLRMQSGLTQENVALKSGLSQGYINQLESGKRRYTQKSLDLIAKALSVPVAEFFRDEALQAVVSGEEIARFERKRPDKKEFMALLKELPDQIVEHYLTLLKLERDILKGKG